MIEDALIFIGLCVSAMCLIYKVYNILSEWEELTPAQSILLSIICYGGLIVAFPIAISKAQWISGYVSYVTSVMLMFNTLFLISDVGYVQQLIRKMFEKIPNMFNRFKEL